MNRRQAVLAALLAAAAAPPAAALDCSACTEDFVPCTLSTGAYGTVTDQVTGLPIEGALIEVFAVGQTSSQSDGSYAIFGELSSYCMYDYLIDVEVTATGHEPATYYAIVFASMLPLFWDVALAPLGTPTPHLTSTPTPAPTWTPTPSPTETCLPCYPIGHVHLDGIDDAQGECTDGDERPDAGETALLDVHFSIDPAGCGTLFVDDWMTDNPHVQLVAAGDDFLLVVGPEVACGTTVTLTFLLMVDFCDYLYVNDDTLELLLETDELGGGAWECDDTPCEGTATPTPECGIDLELSQTQYRPNDHFRLTARPFNHRTEPLSAHEWIILEVYGDYWFWPTWSRGLDYFPITIPAGGELAQTILDFTWPTGAGAAASLRFWAALTDPETGELLGEFDMVEWEFGA